MALNKIELIDVIKRHNDPNDATTIVSIQGTSVSNFFPERMRKGDIISIDNDDIVWKEYGTLVHLWGYFYTLFVVCVFLLLAIW